MNNRRCHGETIACHDCGPRLLAKMRGSLSVGPWNQEELLQSAKDLLFHGEIIMVKSVGGYNLVCRGDRDDAVQRLRVLKQRRDKPFALLVATVGEAEKLCHISREEKELLESPQKPIVLLKRRKKSMPLISPAVTELTESLGVFLPPFGLYALLAEIKIPLVVTSCNFTGEPIIYKQADAFAFYESHESISALFYDEREILRPADDSVARIAAGAVQILRRTRGYMPEPVAVEKKGMRVLALGGEVEPSFALSVNDLIYSAQVPSDLTLEKSSAFTAVLLLIGKNFSISVPTSLSVTFIPATLRRKSHGSWQKNWMFPFWKCSTIMDMLFPLWPNIIGREMSCRNL